LDQDRTFYLVDSYFREKIQLDSNRAIWIEANEENKTMQTVEQIIIDLSEMGMTAIDHLTVVGGGCIQDIGTLAASLYMRGVDWTYVPTTLAAMGDSCIGGKSSINAGSIKNLVGNFYPPKKVIIDPKWCSTLPAIEILAGISEIIKICYARSATTFLEAVEMAKTEELKNDLIALKNLIHLSLASKKYFIEEDEFDKGVRKLLNFGHSFGHALEKSSNYAIPHGVAVLVGMIAAISHPEAEISRESEELRVVSLKILQGVKTEILEPLMSFDVEDFSYALSKDKKNTSEDLLLILPKRMGLELIRDPFSTGALNRATKAMEAARNEILNEIR
jgi:3-dehydroquinate synthase